MSFREYLRESLSMFYHGSPYLFDRFDMGKVGSGDGLSKYGFGLYFADSEDLAAYYARENFLSGDKSHSGMHIYEVRISGLEDFYAWDDKIPEHLYLKIADELEENGFESDAESMREELQSYGETYTMDQTYGILRDTFKSDKMATEFLYNDVGVSGVISDDIQGRGKIYVVFSEDLVKINSHWRLDDLR